MNPMWRRLEDYMTSTGGRDFTATGLAHDLGISTGEATQMIQRHRSAQRSGRPTMYVIHRTGRTKSAVWHVGTRVADLRQMTRQVFDDMSTHIHDVLVPDMDRMQALNPRMGRLVAATVAALEANLAVMEAGLP